MAYHTNYWSCSKFADWLRGTPKGGAKSMEDWEQWRVDAKAANPVRYWLAEEGLSHIQDIVTWPVRKIYDAKYYINNRWVTGTHRLTSRLKPGQWHEYETRLLHCLFDELVNYVEVEEAGMLIAWDIQARDRYKPPFYAWGWFKVRTWRCAEAGLERLRWAASLTDVDDTDTALPGKPTSQALAAQEIIELYTWWQQGYPNRPDPSDASGWSEVCDQRSQRRHAGDKTPRTQEELDRERLALARYTEIEEAYNTEDEAMLIRLIKVRRSMWT